MIFTCGGFCLAKSRPYIQIPCRFQLTAHQLFCILNWKDWCIGLFDIKFKILYEFKSRLYFLTQTQLNCSHHIYIVSAINI